ncbi:CHAP domain-containing protein [Lactococcus raffinolactis]|uniref:CHAP domain-containing protein n=1 Tax=Pseudolactococcus raffinolactis TaxID=1366 RepID=UPI003CC979D4
MKLRKCFIYCLAPILILGMFIFNPLKSEASSGGIIGDDYPTQWKNLPVSSGSDTWGYSIRNCTSFVANRLSTVNKFEVPRALGNGGQWGASAQARGYLVDSSPVRGSVAYFVDGSYGHVAWVAEVNGNAVTIEEYNYGIPLNQGKYHTRVINKSEATGYIHFKDMVNIDNTLGDWVTNTTWSEMNVGINDYYKIPHTLRWQYYDVNKKQWHEIQNGQSNWITLAVNKGQYLINVDVLDSNNKVLETKTMGTDGATSSIINGTNVTREANGEYLLGVSSNNPYMSYQIKLYNRNTGQWFTQFNSQWARFKPEAGVQYIVQFEIYGWNRLLDYKSFGFVG